MTRQSKRLAEQQEAYKPCKENEPVITAVGHAHIDVAWLWC